MAESEQWATPGVPWTRPAAAPAADLEALTAAVEQVLTVDPSLLPPGVAVARAEALLAAQDRVALAGVRAVGDVEQRDLWQRRQAGSTRTWLRTLPGGDRGQLGAWRALRARPRLEAAVAEGSLALRTAMLVAGQLSRVPAQVQPEQLQAVLVDGLGDAMSVWAGAACLEPTPEQHALFETRRGRLAAAVQAGLEDSWSGPADRLEPALVLLSQELAPADVGPAVGLLIDALQPEAQADEAVEQAYRDRSLVLRKLRGGGWSLRAHLTDEVGQLAYDQLLARTRPQKAAENPVEASGEDVFGRPGAGGDARAPESGNDDPRSAGTAPDHSADTDAFGTTGPGRERDPFGPASLSDPAEQGTPLPSREQRWHDAFAQLLVDVLGVRPASSGPPLTALTVLAPLEALQGRPGAPPGRLRTSHGDVPLTSSQLRAHACRSLLSVVLRDAHGRPVGASGEHRHATARERRVVRAVWGSTCAVLGCTLTGTVPHHVEPFWKTGLTRQADLAPLCEHHHHDVHEGHKTLRLRDSRLVDELGWADQRHAEQQRWAG